MKIMKFVAPTEQEAILKARDELGKNAIVLNIKTIKPWGIMRLFRRPSAEVTAAVDETDKRPQESDGEAKRQLEKIKELESKLGNTELLLSKMTHQLGVAEQMIKQTDKKKYDNELVQLFYDTLIKQGVLPEVAETVLLDVSYLDEKDKNDINLITKIVYNTIIGIIGWPEPIAMNPQSSRYVIFMGPTGVGKTTTLVKISSDLTLNKNCYVRIITADTYRIAAIDQLKTYAEILGLDITVVYGSEDLKANVRDGKNEHDLVLIDTAGRSHKNYENIVELRDLISVLPNCQKFLVLSLSTGYEDLSRIVNAFSSVSPDFTVIYTKLDETDSVGSILNISYMTGKKISYIAFGQNVPDDIEIARPEKIAKALLGIGVDIF